ncbi:DNA mismatch repair protein [Metschnikowia bicuspidata var. bicuspidata NRRL YB-4993]|uniref:DNA mismatch repair protein n=1 Tax=Metschnikowia bicuspidata var. bicuspidata NRRL YB-4993 TaxID=869754 RepID=A0A1A0H7X2_9ASCO|nr:DNA mismatch repair protein [Metschnikowia bicuspidata var. bicuspidata NRRL YB-4993]OBA19992.1 DNA mismatch repair protein [Metschnikowia bicuspidata var. bicuspidata NRRL YB-4993]
MSSTRPDLKFSDTVDERLFYRKFNSLVPKENASIVRIIDHKDYFSVLGEDAILIAEAIYKTLLVIKTSNSVNYVTFSPQVFSSVLRFCLVANSYKVEIYNKMFALILTATPGNLEGLAQEYGVDLEAMLNDGSVPMVASVKFVSNASSKKVGVSLVDLSNKSIQLSEFEDNDLFSNLELLLLQVNVKEVILPSSYNPEDQSTPDVIKLFQVLNKVGGLVIGSVKQTYFSTKDIDQDLSKIVVSENVESDVNNNVELILASKGISSTEDSLSLSCCSSLIHYLNLLGDDTTSFTIGKYLVSEYMKIDSSTMKALNIFPTLQATEMVGAKSKSITSIFGLLNKCKTSAGTRLLSQWLKQPLTDLEQISERHSLVGHFIADTSLRVFVSQEWLSQVPDIKRLIKKVALGIKRPSSSENKKMEDVVRLYQLVRIIPELLKMLQMSVEDCENENVKLLVQKNWHVPILAHHESLLKFQELVETTIDLTPLESFSAHAFLHTDFNIKPEFDESLITINENLQSTSSKIKIVHEEVADDLNIDMEKRLKLEKHQQHGWCFRVTRIDSNVLRNTGDRYIELQTVKAGVFFTTKKLRTLSQNYTDFSNEYNSKQKELIKEILSITLTYQTVFLKLSLALSSLDVISSFANVAIFAPTPLVKPKLHRMADSVKSKDFENRRIRLKEARHPVLEVQDEVNFIPNDVSLANTDGSPFVIITGPNMGGKSTYIRQIGVISLMNQVGSYVPVLDENEEPELPIFDAILSRVGAGDSQLKGLSTFMIEMLETSSILASATHNSLIIIDELGRGTSTYDGFGLAWSISEHLITEKNCFTLFATHFHELTKLSEKHKGKVQNLHVVAHIEKDDQGDPEDDDITLMFKVEPGISDKSFGIHVAELVKFPSKIINMAKRKASELQNISVGSDTDPYVSSKRTKCNNEEIAKGLEKLKKILTEWRAHCVDSNQHCSISSEEAIQKLRQLIDTQHKDSKDEKFIAEILTML